MKTLLIAAATLAGFGLVAVIALGGVLASAYHDATSTQRPIIDAIANRDTSAFFERCTPELQASIDQPMLLLWMQGIHEVLGDRQPVSGSSFRFKTSWESGREITTTDAKMRFEFGHADIEIVTVDGKMDSFNFEPSRPIPLSGKRPQDITLYEQRGQQLLMDLASEDPSQGLPNMHPKLQELLPPESLASLNANVREALGEVTSVEPIGFIVFDDQSDELKISYEIQAARGSVDATVSFVLVGLRGQVIGFNFNLDEVR